MKNIRFWKRWQDTTRPSSGASDSPVSSMAPGHSRSGSCFGISLYRVSHLSSVTSSFQASASCISSIAKMQYFWTDFWNWSFGISGAQPSSNSWGPKKSQKKALSCLSRGCVSKFLPLSWFELFPLCSVRISQKTKNLADDKHVDHI